MWPGAKHLPAATPDCSCHQVGLLQESTFQWKAILPPGSIVIAHSPLHCGYSFVVNNCPVTLLAECRCSVSESPLSLSHAYSLLLLTHTSLSDLFFTLNLRSNARSCPLQQHYSGQHLDIDTAPRSGPRSALHQRHARPDSAP